MKKQTYFHIPTPCHENWDNMTTATKGRFCASCSKQVVDFSVMTDQQVLNYFKQSTGKVCGRFADDQLQRPMILASEQKKKTWWVAAMMPLLLLFGKANAQKKKVAPTLGTPAMIVKDTMPMLMGKPIPTQIIVKKDPQELILNNNNFGTKGDTVFTMLSNKVIIKGHITDAETGEPLPYTNILINGSKEGTFSNDSGNFILETKLKPKLATITFAYIGYETKEINLNNHANDIMFVKHNNETVKEINLNEQVLTMQQYTTGGLVEVTVGRISSCTIPKPKDTIKTTVNKIIKRESFKVYPNPAQKDSNIKIEIKRSGEYSIQLLDNSSKLILVKDFNAITDKSLIEIQLPASALPGIYYISLIDETKKKQYTSKLIVQ